MDVKFKGPLYWKIIDSPLGDIFAGWEERGVVRISFYTGDTHGIMKDLRKRGYAPIDVDSGRPIIELKEYFSGERREFRVTPILNGTDFQVRVWEELLEIPYGETRSYREISKAVGRDKAWRATGSAISRNEIPIIIPCHRVIGSDGKLTGYSGGLERKSWLLAHESKNMIVRYR